MRNKAVFKWNNSNLALLCSKCSVIIKVGYEFTEEEHLACMRNKYLKPQYCEKCLKII
jgi:hypothetical protein